MPDRPNFLVIVSDQHHAGIMGCAGDGVVRTPNLDRIASRGVRFDQCYCASPCACPRAWPSMTGQYPSDTRAWCNEDVPGSDIPTFAHALSTGGYVTVLCGRMHFFGPDQRHGFEGSSGKPKTTPPVITPRLKENALKRAGARVSMFAVPAEPT